MLRSGLRVSSRNFVARALRNTCGHPRLGLIAGRKAAARAVDRNRVKRLIREIFRADASAFGPFDVTIQLRNDLRSQNNESVRTELRGLLDSLDRRCKAEPVAKDDASANDARRAAAKSAVPSPEVVNGTGTAPHRHQ